MVSQGGLYGGNFKGALKGAVDVFYVSRAIFMAAWLKSHILPGWYLIFSRRGNLKAHISMYGK